MANCSKKDKKPVLIYDGDCGFCRLWIARLSPLTHEAVDYCSAQAVGENYPQISPEQLGSSVYFVDSDESFCSGAEAIFKALAYAPNGKWLLMAYERIPGMAPVSEWLYKRVANNRKLFSTFTL
jgi:predicted DCC family thiol-disulfide oxidoreductase YuxK